MKSLLRKLFLTLGLALTALGMSGCASPEKSDNISERPWNAPQGWENGVPGSLYQYR